MARMKKEKFDHGISSANIKVNSLDGRITRDEGSPYLNIEDVLFKMMKTTWESNMQVVLDLHLQWRFLERIFFEGKFDLCRMI